MADIFISYAREDQELAERLKSLLDAEGWKVWWDQEIRIGKPYSKEIDKALAQAKIVFVLWSKASAASRWVKKEATRAFEYEKLFGVKLEACKVPENLRSHQESKLIGWKGVSDHPALTTLYKSLAERVPPSNIRTVRPGYKSDFLGAGHKIGWPAVHGVARQLHYLHFSVVMNPARRLPWYVAYNVDWEAFGAKMERPRRWMPDPLISEEFQPADENFKRSGLDRGHLVAYGLLGWGERREAWIAGRQMVAR